MKLRIDGIGWAVPLEPGLQPFLVAHATTDGGTVEFLLGGDDPWVMGVGVTLNITREPLDVEMDEADPRIIAGPREIGLNPEE